MLTSRRLLSGFTLIELIATLVLVGIVAAVSAPFLGNAFRAYFMTQQIAETDWQGRVAMERLTRELRLLRATSDLTITSAADITFLDVDGNSIRYCLGAVGTCPGSAGNLMRNSQSLASGISALSFTYLTSAGAATVVAANVYYITVGFTATQGANSRTFRGTVSPRNV